MHASDAMRVTNCLGLAAGTLEATYTASRAWAVKRDHAPSQDSASASLLDPPANVVVSCHQCVGPVRHRAINSSDLRLTTDRECRQVGQHRSHIVAAVSSASLIARAAASGSQGRIMSSLSPGRGRVQMSACLLSGVICRRSVRPIRSEFSDGWRVHLYVLLEISPNLPSTQLYSFGKLVL